MERLNIQYVHMLEYTRNVTMNNKKLMLLFALSAIYCHSHAQLVHSYGVKVGIAQASQNWNYSGMFTGVTVYQKPRLGLNVGVFVEWLNIPVISVMTEVHYIQKGAEDEYEVRTVQFPEGTGEMRTLSPRIDYLSIPLLAKLRYETPYISLYSFGGPRFDILTGNNNDASGAVFNEFKSSEYGLTFGAGIEVPLITFYRIGCEIRRSYSSQNAFANQVLTVKNNSTELLLTIGF